MITAFERTLERVGDPRPRRALMALLLGGVLGGALLALVGGAALYAYWLHRCGVRGVLGVCLDPERVARWSSLHALLMGMHGAGVGGAIGLLATLLVRARHSRLGATLAGGGLALALGALASHAFWTEPGTAVVAVIALPLHASVGAVLAFLGHRGAQGASIECPAP
jgi:hypothetical protein